MATKKNPMKTIKCYFFVFLLALGLYSCKKEDTNSNTGSGGVNSNGNNITSSNATSFYGIFMMAKFQSIISNTLSTYYAPTAYFSSSPVQYADPTTAVRVDSVKLNGVPMMFFSDSTYIDSSGLATGFPPPVAFPYTYRVVGNHGIPSFSYTENGPFPSFTGYGSWPDTIHIFSHSGISISLGGISAADYVSINLHGGSKTITHNFFPPFPASTNFSVSELSQIDTSSYSSIEIVLLKINNNKLVYGKPMAFSMGYNWTKNISVK